MLAQIPCGCPASSPPDGHPAVPGAETVYGTPLGCAADRHAASGLRHRRFPEAPPAIMPSEGSLTATVVGWPECSSGYARCSTDAHDLTAQRDALAALGVKPNRIYVDHGLTGTNRARPGLREALAACRAFDTFVVTMLDR